jgi:hypothetical protein
MVELTKMFENVFWTDKIKLVQVSLGLLTIVCLFVLFILVIVLYCIVSYCIGCDGFKQQEKICPKA